MRALAKLGFLRFAGLLAIATSCNGKVLNVGDDDPAPVQIDPALLAQCAAPSETTYRFDTDEAMQAALVGRWFRCRGHDTGVLYFDGVEFDDLGRWWALESIGPSGYVRSSNPARIGTYTTLGPSLLFFFFDNSASQSLVVLFDQSKQKMNVVYSTREPVDVSFLH